MFVYGGPSRKKLQERIQLLINNLETIMSSNKEYYNKMEMFENNELTQEDIDRFVEKTYNTNSYVFSSDKSTSLGDRMDIIIEKVDGRT